MLNVIFTSERLHYTHKTKTWYTNVHQVCKAFLGSCFSSSKHQTCKRVILTEQWILTKKNFQVLSCLILKATPNPPQHLRKCCTHCSRCSRPCFHQCFHPAASAGRSPAGWTAGSQSLSAAALERQEKRDAPQNKSMFKVRLRPWTHHASHFMWIGRVWSVGDCFPWQYGYSGIRVFPYQCLVCHLLRALGQHLLQQLVFPDGNDWEVWFKCWSREVRLWGVKGTMGVIWQACWDVPWP